jgi:hypothetical protein
VGSSHVRNCDGKDHPDSASARGGLYSCGFPDDHTYETRASKISEDGKRMFRIEKKTPNGKIVYEEMYEKIKEASLDLIDGPAGELNGSKSSGRAVVGARKPAGVNRCISCKCRNLVRIWSASTGVVSLVSRGSLQPSFPTTAVYWHGLVPGHDQKELCNRVRAYLRLHRLRPNSPCPIRGLEVNCADMGCRGGRSLASKPSALHVFRA